LARFEANDQNRVPLGVLNSTTDSRRRGYAIEGEEGTFAVLTISLFADRVRRGVLAWALTGAFGLIALSYVVYLIVEPVTAQALSEEDGLIETLGASFALTASLLFLFCYLRSSSQRNRFFGSNTRRNFWFLALAALLFVAFGEEISWGQRIFGWETPAAFQELNAQEETNLHNLWFSQAKNPDGSRKSSLQLLLNANRLYSIFWLTFCVLVPVLVHSSNNFRRLMAFVGIPVPPLEIGALFLTNYLLSLAVVAFAYVDQDTVHAFDELKESNYALCFLILAFYFSILAKEIPVRPSTLASRSP
jgi:hypothetical protein